MKIYENEYLALDLHVDQSKLDLHWKSETAEMNDADFKASLYVYACFAIEHGVSHLIVHIHSFGFGGAMSEDLTAWRNEQIFPKYSQAGATKMAFLGNGDQLPPQDPPRHPNASFDTRFFSDEQEMATWLAG